MNIVAFLFIFPLITAVVLLIVPQLSIRKGVVSIAAVLLSAATIVLLLNYYKSGTLFLDLEAEWINYSMMLVELGLTIYVIIAGTRVKQYLASLLMVAQFALIIYFELAYGQHINPAHNLFIDNFSLVMAVIIGVIGTLICLYAVGYMEDYHHHHNEIKNRTGLFFFVMFVFLSAMFGVVFSNNLLWLYFFWEITTFCSFLLIGYTQTQEAIANAFRALKMNLLGGVAFAGAIVYIYTQNQVIELDKLLLLDKTIIMIPVVLMSFAGLTKSAQFPFSSWLVGAMVAPTPTSALLHSSTMVKAGVYLIIRLAPVLQKTVPGFLVALVGAVTFLLASGIAISQVDAKKVLAYSTIANLGLIVTCAGCGTYETVWAAIFLIIFHAVAKSLLFLSVGSIEHNLGDRNIETMEGLIVKMPHLAVLMIIGISGMFLAPFGMLLSKWAALEALVRANPILAVFVAFGSAVTLFFWTKWMGKVITIKGLPGKYITKIHHTERAPLDILAVLTVAICLLFPVASFLLIEPYVMGVYGNTVNLGQGNILIMLIMMGMIFLLPLRLLFYKDLNYVEAYLGGSNVEETEQFLGSMGVPRKLRIKNYYLEKYFGEGILNQTGVIFCSFIILIMFGVGII